MHPLICVCRPLPHLAAVPAVTYFNAQLQILELLEHKSILSAGYKAVLHVHSVVEECEITKLLAQMDPRTKEKKKVRLRCCTSWCLYWCIYACCTCGPRCCSAVSYLPTA